MIHLDTHVVVWLYAGRVDLLSGAARKRLDEDEPVISPMVLLELEYLRETGRISVPARTVSGHLQARIGLRLCDVGFPRIIEAALAEDWTGDPFDRVIVGHAAAARADLITRDSSIRATYPHALW